MHKGTIQPIHLIHLGPVFPLEYKKRMYIRVLTYDFGHILGVNCEYTNNSGCFAPILQTFGVNGNPAWVHFPHTLVQ